jgi:2-dehydro-3-deoxyphosphooctonate aldolase (KDO 8-P synthase)
MTQKTITIGNVDCGNDLPMMLIAGPCQIESSGHAVEVAGRLKDITAKLGIGFIYKSSFDKANRTSLSSKRGLGLTDGLKILGDVAKVHGCPVLTDVHLPEQCDEVGDIVDVLQIPAFLCRQTDLLIAAAETGKVVNIKKGQFLAPWDMVHVATKVSDSGNDRILLTERGTCFGYNTLVTDMRGLPQLAGTGYPVIFDATHSVQQPGGLGGVSGGQRKFVPVLSRAAIAVGVAGLFMETHENPDAAPSDGPNMVPLDQMEDLLMRIKSFDEVAKSIS